MKVIDLLNKIAKGEINEDTLIEFDNGYRDYCSVKIFFDRYIVDRENLNCEVEIIGDTPKEDKKIEKLNMSETHYMIDHTEIMEKINEIIDRLNGDKQ